MTPAERALELIDLTYRASTDRDAWSSVAKAFSDLFGGAGTALMIQTPGLELPSAVFYCGIDPDLAPHARTMTRTDSAWMATVGPELGTRFIRLADYFDQDELPDSDFARFFLAPQGFAIESPIVHVTSPEEAVLSSGIVVYRRADGPPITEEQLGIADRVVPHLKRAIAIHSRLANREHQKIALHEVIDRIPTGVVILDSHAQPIVINRMAARIVRSNDGLVLTDEGPRTRDRETTSALSALIESAIHPAPGRELSAGGFLAIPRPSGLRSFPVLVTPILGRSPDSTMADAAAVLFISDPEFRDVALTTVLTDVYGLTPAEAELAQLLAQGRSLEEAAGIRGVTLNTARSQLKQVFAKTETNRQGELLQLVLSSVGVIDRNADVGPHGRE